LYTAVRLLLVILLSNLLLTNSQSLASESWEKLDKRLKNQVFQLNVGLKLRLKDNTYAQLADLSRKYHYPIFSTSKEDKGFRVVGFGSTFPLAVNRHDKTYLITNRHVAESATQISKECERFFAALSLYAEQTAAGANYERRYNNLLDTINLAGKKDLTVAERTLYQSTGDAIWDCYDTFLSLKADPTRTLFQKHLGSAGIQSEVSYFLHKPGPIKQLAIEASMYKIAKKDTDPDLAILTIDTSMAGMELENIPPSEGQEIQVIGYPTASDQIDLDSSKYYSPTFSTGRVSRIGPRILQVDASITNGNSGGPVIDQRGKVLGVVAVRAISSRGGELPNFAGAVTVPSIKAFAKELF
jgi:S1-C subfamily serine protease